MEDAYIIKGGKLLQGTVDLSGAKNVALKTIIASLIFNGEVYLENIPRIGDVHELINLIEKLGVKCEFIRKNTLYIDNSGLSSNKVDLLHAAKTRVSFMLFVPLLYKFGSCFIPNPGGCRIGARPINRAIAGLKALGANIIYNHATGYYEAKLTQSPKGEYTFKIPTHTGTELLMMFSVLCQGTITLNNVALEPEIDNLIKFLNESGARIWRKNGKIIIKGVKELRQRKPFAIASDRNEAITYASVCIASKGSVKINNINKYDIKSFTDKLLESGCGVNFLDKSTIEFFYKNDIKGVNVETGPHPGFMTDWQPNWAVLMTQAKGDSVIHERVYENRFSYVPELTKLGASIDFVDPLITDPKDYYYFNYRESEEYKQAITIHGGNDLHGGALVTADLRAGASIVCCSLIAKGESVIYGASIIERGYEDFVSKVNKLGGDIKKI
ncbi:MAG: UDP-N-acetylglucosamine 1-carboxyvinyltransferase [bacterium]